MIRISDLDDRKVESYMIQANRMLERSPGTLGTSQMASLIATVEMLDDSLTTLRAELRGMAQQAADNNEMIWRLKRQVSDLEKESS